MLDVGTPLFVVIQDESSEGIYHPGEVVESDEETFVAEFEHLQDLPLGLKIRAYYEIEGKFYRQKALVMEIGRSSTHPLIKFQCVGMPVSAEKRSSYRVRVARMVVAKRIGDEMRCSITDVSPEGFAAITRKALTVGSSVNVRIEYETEVVEGPARVQCITALLNGRHRCGFLVPERNTKMRRSMERISTMIQRLHLRTMAGYRALDANVEVSGETVYAIIDGMGAFRETALKILAKQGIVNPQPGEWYKQQAWLNAFSVISEKLGSDALFNIGMKVSENADFLPGIETLDKALSVIDAAYHTSHRNGEIGHYYFDVRSDDSYEMVCKTPYPCDFDRGLLTALCSRYKPAGTTARAVVTHDDSKPCRKKGADSCTYLVTWQDFQN